MKGTTALLRKLDAISDAVAKMPDVTYANVQTIAIRMQGEYDRASSEPEDISVYAEQIPGGCQIVGTGEDIFFVEFGTGLFYSRNPIPHPYNEPASWSATHAQYLTDPVKLEKYKGYWPYNGRWVSGQPSANVFYEAGKDVGPELTKLGKDHLDRVIKS